MRRKNEAIDRQDFRETQSGQKESPGQGYQPRNVVIRVEEDRVKVG